MLRQPQRRHTLPSLLHPAWLSIQEPKPLSSILFSPSVGRFYFRSHIYDILVDPYFSFSEIISVITSHCAQVLNFISHTLLSWPIKTKNLRSICRAHQGKLYLFIPLALYFLVFFILYHKLNHAFIK